jgi:hypothetical protein
VSAISSNLRAPVHGDAAWRDSAPPSLDCFAGHLGDLADRYTQLAGECRDLHDAVRLRIAAGRKPTKAQLRLTLRIGCQISTEDINDHADPPLALREIAEIGDALYFDAIRLDGSTVWDGDSWGDAKFVAARKAGTSGPKPEPPPEEKPARPVDALSAAVAIARSASLKEVDWGREPLTEREAAVRTRWIEKQLADRCNRRLLESKVVLRRLGGKPVASDLAAADAEARRIDAENEAAEQLAELTEVADELDGIVRDDRDDDEESAS